MTDLAWGAFSSLRPDQPVLDPFSRAYNRLVSPFPCLPESELMADEEPLLGVSAATPTPADWPADSFAPAPSQAPDPPVWPPAAQWCTAGMMVVFLALLAWRGYGMSRYSTRPLMIENDAEPHDGIDLNKADVVDLRLIPGIGEKMARRIIDHRKKHGPFRSLDDLRKVSGIGTATLERIRPYLRIEVYDEEAPPPPRVVRGAAPVEKPADPVAGRKKAPPAEKIDLNRATAEQLRSLPGVGPALSARIIAARQNRPFRSVEDLRKVKGIGAKTLERLRPYLTVAE
jgi:competence protein ComEA